MSKDLWPEFDVASKSTPKKVIEQTGAGLEEPRAYQILLF